MKQEHHKKNLIAWAFIIGYLVYPVIILVANTHMTGIDVGGMIKDYVSGQREIILLVVYAYFKHQEVVKENEVNNKKLNKVVRKKKIT